MPIEFVNRGTAARLSARDAILARAATDALGAPSIFNTQPWRWRIDGDTARLSAERRRQLATVDPDGRLLTLSCGAALHHAATAVAADGYAPVVSRLPDPDDPDLLAVLRVGASTPPPPDTLRLYRAISMRRTDRRPFGDSPVPDAALDRLRAAAEAHGAYLAYPRPGWLVALAVAAGHAAAAELAEPAYRAELASWVRDSGGAGGGGADDGVPLATAASVAARPVAVRDFTGTLADGPVDYDRDHLADRHATYGVLCTDGDTPRDWLVAGEALSAVLLTAAADGLATSPMSDLVEVPSARRLVRDEVLAGVGYPAIAIRIGVPAAGSPASSPRRRPADAIDVPGVPR